MLDSESFALINLVLWIVVLAVLGVTERRSRTVYYSRDRRIKYRRLTTTAVLKRIKKAKG